MVKLNLVNSSKVVCAFCQQILMSAWAMYVAPMERVLMASTHSTVIVTLATLAIGATKVSRVTSC